MFFVVVFLSLGLLVGMSSDTSGAGLFFEA